MTTGPGQYKKRFVLSRRSLIKPPELFRTLSSIVIFKILCRISDVRVSDSEAATLAGKILSNGKLLTLTIDMFRMEKQAGRPSTGEVLTTHECWELGYTDSMRIISLIKSESP